MSAGWGGSVLHAFDVLAGAGVDADAVAFLDEVRDDELTAGLDGRVLRDVRCRVAADGRVGVRHGQDDVVRRRDPDRVVVIEQDVALHFFLQVLPVFIDQFRGKFVLLVGFRAHEDVRVAVAVEVLRLDLRDVGRLDRVAALPRAFQNRSAQEVAEFAFVERLAFARFDELALDHDEGVAFELDFQTFAKIAGIVTDHGFVPSCLKMKFLPIKLKYGYASNSSKGQTRQTCNEQ